MKVLSTNHLCCVDCVLLVVCVKTNKSDNETEQHTTNKHAARTFYLFEQTPYVFIVKRQTSTQNRVQNHTTRPHIHFWPGVQTVVCDCVLFVLFVLCLCFLLYGLTFQKWPRVPRSLATHNWIATMSDQRAKGEQQIEQTWFSGSCRQSNDLTNLYCKENNHTNSHNQNKQRTQQNSKNSNKQTATNNKPKSAILMLLSASNNKFSGFKSRWTTKCAWQYSTPVGDCCVRLCCWCLSVCMDVWVIWNLGLFVCLLCCTW